MDIFTVGVLVGASLFALVYSVVMLNKLYTAAVLAQQNLDALMKAVQLAFVKLNKIEKVTDNTMHAAETFVDALRESAENMQMIAMRAPKRKGPFPQEGFDDLRKSFEDGIKDMEEDMGEQDEDLDSDEPQEPWK